MKGLYYFFSGVFVTHKSEWGGLSIVVPLSRQNTCVHTLHFTIPSYIINRLPTKVLHFQSPYEVLFNTLPDYSFFKVFGCCYLNLESYNVKCVCLGYSPIKGYRFYDLKSRKRYIYVHMNFDESYFPFDENSRSSLVIEDNSSFENVSLQDPRLVIQKLSTCHLFCCPLCCQISSVLCFCCYGYFFH